MKTILLADDHPLLLEGLDNVIDNTRFNVIKTVTNGVDALKYLFSNAVDVAILDIEMPGFDGFQVVKKCTEAELETKFIILTSYNEPNLFKYATGLNIHGYLLKEDAKKEINLSIESVLDGTIYTSKSILTQQQLLGKSSHFYNFTPSEIKILKLLANKLTSPDISKKLFLSERTTEKHRSNILAKIYKSETDVNLNVWAVENKILINSF